MVYISNFTLFIVVKIDSDFDGGIPKFILKDSSNHTPIKSV